MFAFFRYPSPARVRTQAPASGSAEEGEGRRSEASLRATRALLWRDGRPRVWLLLLLACCVLVVIRALMLA